MGRLLAIRTVESHLDAAPIGASPDLLDPHWFVISTMARHEKQVAAQLAERRIEHFLPTYDTIHRWKDRRVQVTLPLFPGYVFVRIALVERLRVLALPSVSRLVGFGGPPVALPDDEFSRLRTGLLQTRSEPHPYLKVGQKVYIKSGPLSGMQGILQRWNDECRVVLSMDLIMQSIAVEIDLCDLDLI